MMLSAMLILALSASLLLLLSNAFAKVPQIAAGIALGASLTAGMLFFVSGTQKVTLLGMLQSGGLGSLAGVVACLIALLTIWGMLAEPENYRTGPVEVYALVLYAALGGALMVTSNNLLLLYIGIELSSYSTYILVSYHRHNRFSVEAGAKYFTLGAVASALLLYGMSFVFGGAQSIYYSQMVFTTEPSSILLLGYGLMLAGISFKLALVPFHAWTPDAYQGAPAMVAGMLSVGPKVALVLVVIQLLSGVFPHVELWQSALVVLAIITMTLGNFQALGQTNIKRLLGYSSVAQLGTITVGLAVATPEAFEAVALYGVIYAVTNLGAFTALAAFRRAGVKPTLAAYRGLGRRHWPGALLLSVFLLSLAGVPLLAGFVAKLFVFQSAVMGGKGLLAAIAIANTVLAYYYYVRVLMNVWLEPPPETTSQTRLNLSPIALSALGVSALVVVILGILPHVLLDTLQPLLVALP